MEEQTDTKDDTVNGRRRGAGAQSMKSTMQTQQARAEQPPASGNKAALQGQCRTKYTDSPVQNGEKTSSDGSRWERSFTAGTSERCRGHKSAARRRVSSVRQRSQSDSGRVSINRPTDELDSTRRTDKKTHGARGPEASSSAERRDAGKSDIHQAFKKKKRKRRTETTP